MRTETKVNSMFAERKNDRRMRAIPTLILIAAVFYVAFRFFKWLRQRTVEGDSKALFGIGLIKNIRKFAGLNELEEELEEVK